MRTFRNFPEEKICHMCGTSENKECVLIPVDGTSDGKICEAIPIHAECILKGDLRFKRDENIFYKKGI